MESISNGLDGVVCYMDYVVVRGDTTEHDKCLTEVKRWPQAQQAEVRVWNRNTELSGAYGQWKGY